MPPINFVREYPDGNLFQVQIERPEAIADMAKFAQKRHHFVFRLAYGLDPDREGETLVYLGATLKRREKDDDGKWQDGIYVICEEFAENDPTKINEAVDSLVKKAFLYKRG